MWRRVFHKWKHAQECDDADSSLSQACKRDLVKAFVAVCLVVDGRACVDLERDLDAVLVDGEEGALLVAVLHAEERVEGHFLLDHGRSALGDEADAVALLGRFLWNAEDGHRLPAPESKEPVVPPARRHDRRVARGPRSFYLPIESFPRSHVHLDFLCFRFESE